MTLSYQQWHLPTRFLGQCVVIHNQLDSTNSFALALDPDAANHGLVVLAREQTAGRGQYGRTWQAPPGSSVLMTVLLFPPPRLCRPAVLTAWAAVGVCEVISETVSAAAKIKWPNDVYLQGKKVCGILIEQRSAGPGQPPAIAVGIGLNVRQPAEFFDAAGLTLGGSLLSVGGKELDCETVARQLIQHLDAGYSRLREEDYGALEAAWKERLGLIGESVALDTLTGRRVGRLIDVTMAAVVIDAGDVAPVRIVPEAIRALAPAR